MRLGERIKAGIINAKHIFLLIIFQSNLDAFYSWQTVFVFFIYAGKGVVIAILLLSPKREIQMILNIIDDDDDVERERK